MISRLIPLPIPYSSICSPTHIRKIVPAVIMQTETRPCQNVWYCGKHDVHLWTHHVLHPEALCTAHNMTVAYRVYSLIRFRPLSPSFIIASSDGTTLPRSWKMIEAEM